MKRFSLRLRKILLLDYLYYFLLIISLIYLFLYCDNYECKSKYRINETRFELKIINYKINGDKLSINFDNLIGSYYFKSIRERDYFLNNYNLGDIIIINGNLYYMNNNTIPNTFNYKNYLNHKRVKYILTIKNYKLKSKNKNIFIKIKSFLYRRINNINNNEYLYAFILGNSSYIDSGIYDNYKINGIIHLFALSGLHVSIFSMILVSVLKILKISEKFTYLIVSIFLILFSFIASFTPSILRATIFFILTSINKIYYLFIKPKYLLYLTFIILIVINPLFIYNNGFILSFTITFFILLRNENNKDSSILKISFLSFLSSLPIIININYEVNLIGFFNNLIFIPFVTYIIFPISLLTLFFPFLSNILLFFTNIMEVISNISSILLNITIYFSKLNTYLIIIYYILLIIIIKTNKRKVLLFLLIIFFYIKPYFDKNTYIYFLDVGQGDSALIVTENNKSILIDTGGKLTYESDSWKTKNKSYNLMTSTMVNFYKSIGLKKLDYLFLSHADFDHLGYSKDLIDNFNVKNIYINLGDISYNEIILNADVFNEKYIKIDNVEIYSLNKKIYDNENDNSLVFLVVIDNYKILFMGDASHKVEKEIMNDYKLYDIDILKVGHHGSNTSSSKEFINKIAPKYSIISVGKNNRYGHPNKEVLNNLNKSKIYRTDKDGSIMFKIKDSRLNIQTCMP